MLLSRLRFAVERAARRVAHVWWRLVRGMTFGVRGAVFDREGRIFLLRHTYISGWQLPGGGVEVGETALDALARELREEGNIVLRGAPSLFAVYFNSHVTQRDHVLLYVVRDFEQPAPPAPNSEIAETGFFAIDALPPDVTAGTLQRIAEIVNGAPVVEHWRPMDAR